MTKEDFIKRLLELGFTHEGNEFKKDVLVCRQNDAENRFEVFYKGTDGADDTSPVYWYEDLYRGMKQNAFDYYVNGLYDAIKEN